MAGIYLHIPFCKQACHYCDFHFSTRQEHRTEMIAGMCREIALQRDYLAGESIETVYFGGGTPSLLTPDELELLFNEIHKTHSVSANVEITLEANPDDLSDEKLTVLKANGVNRLSIGIQSFDDSVLRFLNRAHDAQGAIKAMHKAQDIGFDNISIDLIYAIPGQDSQQWKRNIRQALATNPQHISAYSLTLEEKTVFGRWLRSGKLQSVSDDIAAEQFEILIEDLKANGYSQYEISNFSLPDRISRHNSAYWKGVPYLGIGPSAHSFNSISRQYNVSQNAPYVSSINAGNIPSTLELLTTQDKINEYLFTSLRTSWGCDLLFLKTSFNHDLYSANGDYIKSLVDQKKVIIQNNVLTLTNEGKLLADKIASDLFVEPVPPL